MVSVIRTVNKVTDNSVSARPGHAVQRCAAQYLLAVIYVLLLGVGSPGYANGWEHLAIPRASLLAALQSGNPHTMEHAAISIGVRAEPRDVVPLLDALDRAGGEHHLRAEIYRALGLIGDAGGVPVLIEALKAEPRDELRAGAAMALGAIGAPEGLPPLLAALEQENRAVRLRIVDALGAFDQSACISALSSLARQKDDAGIKLGALRALGATGAHSAVEPLLAVLEQTDDHNTQAVTVDALGNIAAPESANVLTSLLATTDDLVLEVKLTAALGAIGGQGSVPTLTKLLSSDNRAVQSIAVRSLSETKSPDAASDLKQLYTRLSAKRQPRPTSDSLPTDAAAYIADLDLMRLTVRALLQTDPVTGLESFLDAAQARAFPAQSAAGLKLAARAYELRRLALYSLGYTESSSATAMLLPIAATEADSRLRAVALRSLGVLGGSKGYSAALDAMRDSSAEVRWNAASVLGRLASDNTKNTSDAASALIAAANDPHQQVRIEAISSLGLLGDKRAIDTLSKAAREDTSEAVQEHARQALMLVEQSEPQ